MRLVTTMVAVDWLPSVRLVGLVVSWVVFVEQLVVVVVVVAVAAAAGWEEAVADRGLADPMDCLHQQVELGKIED